MEWRMRKDREKGKNSVVGEYFSDKLAIFNFTEMV
jgi:hypothetical protein